MFRIQIKGTFCSEKKYVMWKIKEYCFCTEILNINIVIETVLSSEGTLMHLQGHPSNYLFQLPKHVVHVYEVYSLHIGCAGYMYLYHIIIIQYKYCITMTKTGV